MYKLINRTEFYECSFLAGPYYLTQTMLSCQTNSVVSDGLFRAYCMFNKIFFDYLEAYHQISPVPEIEQSLMSLSCDIASYDFPDLTFKILDKLLSRRKLDKKTGPIYS